MYARVALGFSGFFVFFLVHCSFYIFLNPFFSTDLPQWPEHIIIYIHIYFYVGRGGGLGRQHTQGLPDAEAWNQKGQRATEAPPPSRVTAVHQLLNE